MSHAGRRNRHTKAAAATNPYHNLVVDILIDALLIASGRSAASTVAEKKIKAEAIHWLQGEQCRRWAALMGVDIDWALNHNDCILEIDNRESVR